MIRDSVPSYSVHLYILYHNSVIVYNTENSVAVQTQHSLADIICIYSTAAGITHSTVYTGYIYYTVYTVYTAHKKIYERTMDGYILQQYIHSSTPTILRENIYLDSINVF